MLPGDAPASCYRIGRCSHMTSTASSIGRTGYGIANQTMADITFTSNGTPYGLLEPSTGALYNDQSDDRHSDIGRGPGMSTYGSGLAAGPGDVLYYAGSGGDGRLRTVNRTAWRSYLRWGLDGSATSNLNNSFSVRRCGLAPNRATR